MTRNQKTLSLFSVTHMQIRAYGVNNNRPHLQEYHKFRKVKLLQIMMLVIIASSLDLGFCVQGKVRILHTRAYALVQFDNYVLYPIKISIKKECNSKSAQNPKIDGKALRKQQREGMCSQEVGNLLQPWERSFLTHNSRKGGFTSLSSPEREMQRGQRVIDLGVKEKCRFGKEKEKEEGDSRLQPSRNRSSTRT